MVARRRGRREVALSNLARSAAITLEEYGRGFVGRILRDELAREGPLEDRPPEGSAPAKRRVDLGGHRVDDR